jgi:hypothetical protein
MNNDIEVEFYNNCNDLAQSVTEILNRGIELNSASALNEIRLKLTDIDPESLENKIFRNHFIVCLLAPYLANNNYDLKSWIIFENDIYPFYKNEIPNYFLLNTIKKNRGDILEQTLTFVINYLFKLDNIHAYSVNTSSKNIKLITMGSFAPKLDLEVENSILQKLHNQFKIPGIPVREVWGDNDIVIVSTKKSTDSFCIISCKSSLRERAFQTAFWAMRSRLEGKFRHVFCTLDFGTAKGKSEIGSRNNEDFTAKKNRDVLESLMDRCYVFRNNEEVPRSHVIKDLEYLKTDLVRWEADFWGL